MAAASASASSAAPAVDTAGFLLPNPLPERGKAIRMHVSADGAYFAYGVGAVVVVRSTTDPTAGFVYEEHTDTVKCANFSPDGKFVASGDAKGEVRVWSTSDASFSLRKALLGLPGGVEDVVWDTSGTILGLAGHGVDKARILTVDSGTDMGAMATQPKPCLAAAASSASPSAFAFGGESNHVGLYSGKPGKLVKNLTEHTAFVNAVAFSPDGTKLVTTGSDKVILVRDAATGEVLCTTKASHKGSVYSVAFSPDGSRLATSSADKTVKVWELAADGSALTAVSTIVVGKAIPDMQNGMVWAGDSSIISTSLCGRVNFAEPSGSAPTRVVEGPGGTVTMMRSHGGVFLTGDRSGAVCLWTRKDGAAGFEAARVTGDGHPKVVNCGDIRDDRFVTGGFDDKLRFGSVATGAYSAVATVGAQPKSVVIVPTKPNVAVVATSKFTKSFDTDSGAELSSIDAKWEGKAVAATSDGSMVFVGGGDGHVRSYSVDASGVLTEAAVTATPLKSAVASLAVSPDGGHVAAGDASKELVVLQAASLDFVIKDTWTAHTSRIAALAWNSTGTALASTGVDRHVFIWALSESFPIKRHNLAVASPAHSICWEEGDAAVWVSSSNGVTKRIEISL